MRGLAVVMLVWCYNAGRLRYPVENGMMDVEIGAFGAMIFEEKNT